MSAKYKLTYFNGRGRAETARLMFAYKGVTFEDDRVEFPDWGKKKPQTPQGTMPILEVEGVLKDKKTLRLCQSGCINKYLAREFGLFGTGKIEPAVIEMIYDTASDLLGKWIDANFSSEESIKASHQQGLEDMKTRLLPHLNSTIKEFGGKSGYAVGDKVTLADVHLYFVLEQIGVADKELNTDKDKYGALLKNREKIIEDRNIKQWVDKRQKTPF